MGWSIGFDSNWSRDIGYGVPCECDEPTCRKEIDRGLAYVCGSAPYGGEHGCGLYFCHYHLDYHPEGKNPAVQLCERCLEGKEPFKPKPDVEEWVVWKLTDKSWQKWREDNASQVEQMKRSLTL